MTPQRACTPFGEEIESLDYLWPNCPIIFVCDNSSFDSSSVPERAKRMHQRQEAHWASLGNPRHRIPDPEPSEVAGDSLLITPYSRRANSPDLTERSNGRLQHKLPPRSVSPQHLRPALASARSPSPGTARAKFSSRRSASPSASPQRDGGFSNNSALALDTPKQKPSPGSPSSRLHKSSSSNTIALEHPPWLFSPSGKWSTPLGAKTAFTSG